MKPSIFTGNRLGGCVCLELSTIFKILHIIFLFWAAVSKGEYTYGWYSTRRQEITRIRFKSIFNSINHVRAQAAHDREHGWYISLHYVEVVHFTHNSRKSSEEHCTQPRCADQAQYHTSEVWLHRDATRPLQRFPNLYYLLRFQAAMVITIPNEEDALTKTYIHTSRGPSYTPSTHSPFALSVRPLQPKVSN